MTSNDLLCFSHLRWDFVFQRPNHLMTRCAKTFRVAFIEEPMFGAAHVHLEVSEVHPNLWRVIPRLREELSTSEAAPIVAHLLRDFCIDRGFDTPTHWYYTPMMLPFGESVPQGAVVYDCMDELSNFLGAPAELAQLESRLLAKAQVVFTGGMALYEAKRARHGNIHPAPSSVDTAFFRQARNQPAEPEDQAALLHPRAGYCGVIDERLDLELLAQLAERFSNVNFVMLGPIVKIDRAALPRRKNIHYLGGKPYTQLPNYMAHWDVALMPFALNDATRFISPTKTPEYLAAGLPVVSTAIRDVVEPYERLGLVQIGRDEEEFAGHLNALLSASAKPDLEACDAFLARMSWDATWAFMEELLREAQRPGYPSARRAGPSATQGGAHV